MGKYRPAKKQAQRSVSDALKEAEHDHFIDCPNADMFTRIEAGVLDCIFLVIMGSGLDRLYNLAVVYLNFVPEDVAINSLNLVTAVKIALQALLFYLYWIRTVSVFGGSPAKLLLRLRVVDDSNGQKLDFRRTILREVVGKALGVLTLGFGFYMASFRKDHRSLHDLISRSSVKRVFERK